MVDNGHSFVAALQVWSSAGIQLMSVWGSHCEHISAGYAPGQNIGNNMDCATVMATVWKHQKAILNREQPLNTNVNKKTVWDSVGFSVDSFLAETARWIEGRLEKCSKVDPKIRYENL